MDEHLSMAVLLKQEDVLAAIKEYFENQALEINLNDEEIITKVCNLCRKNEAISNDSHVFPVI